jgi:hypothetical protein
MMAACIREVVAGNPLQDIALIKQVDFAMKTGTVYKRNGEPTDAALKSSLGM